jgi:RNA polymerase sigma factor (sigma-70 family)
MTHDGLSDLELLAGWRRGDNTMGSTLFRRHVESITAFFRRNIYDRAEVEDLTQESFIALRESTSPVENVSGYLYRIAFFKFTRHLRKRKSLPEQGDPNDDLQHVAGDLTPDPEYVLAQKEDTRLLLRAIRRLALIHQQVLELSFWGGKKNPEIAAILGVPVGTVASRLRLAKEKLDEKLAELADTQEALRATTMTVEEWRKRLQLESDPAPADGPRRRGEPTQ